MICLSTRCKSGFYVYLPALALTVLTVLAAGTVYVLLRQVPKPPATESSSQGQLQMVDVRRVLPYDLIFTGLCDPSWSTDYFSSGNYMASLNEKTSSVNPEFKKLSFHGLKSIPAPVAALNIPEPTARPEELRVSRLPAIESRKTPFALNKYGQNVPVLELELEKCTAACPEPTVLTINRNAELLPVTVSESCGNTDNDTLAVRGAKRCLKKLPDGICVIYWKAESVK